MPFNHRAQAADDALLPKGEYDASVKRAAPRVSKKGNNMLELILTVYAEGGRREDVFDYLIDGDSTAWKIRDFCASAGIDYDAGQIDESAIEGVSVRILLDIEKAQNGYPAKNKVAAYLPQEPKTLPPAGPKSVARTPASRTPEPEFQATDDDVPF